MDYDNPDLIYFAYKYNTSKLHNYMKRQWNFIAEMSNTFKEMKL